MILKLKDEKGNVYEVPALKGSKGDKGDRGARGETGVDGTKWHYGTAVSGTESSIMMPTGTGAKTGDFYLNTDTGNVYVSTNGETFWKYLMCIKGTSSASDSYTKSEIDAIMGDYVNDISALLGGDA